jgi:hypothetical protein
VTRYLLSIYQPDGDPPEPAVMAGIAAGLHEFNQDLRAAGAWLFTGGLHAASSATVVHPREGQPLLTDGPYVEAKEHVGGVWIIEADDLDAALSWAGRATGIIGLPIEVRPFQDVEPY